MKHIWFHCQNLNERKNGQKGTILRHGRAWLHFGHDNCIGWSWNFGTHFFHAYAEIGGWGSETDLTVSLATPLLAFWFHVERLWPKWIKRKINEKRMDDIEVRFGVHDWSLWWSLWHPVDSWSSRTPKWRHGSFNILDFVLGRNKYSESEISISQVNVSMPERDYPASVKIFESTWKRPRWPFNKRMIRADINLEVPIPVPGKGENDWDIDDDAIHSMTCPASNVEDAVTRVRESALKDRIRYGGYNWIPKEVTP